MIGTHHHPARIACLLVVAAATLYFALAICIIKEVEHAALGRLYLALGFVTLMGLVCILWPLKAEPDPPHSVHHALIPGRPVDALNGYNGSIAKPTETRPPLHVHGKSRTSAAIRPTRGDLGHEGHEPRLSHFRSRKPRRPPERPAGIPPA
jgi:hypothetical protein